MDRKWFTGFFIGLALIIVGAAIWVRDSNQRDMHKLYCSLSPEFKEATEIVEEEEVAPAEVYTLNGYNVRSYYTGKDGVVKTDGWAWDELTMIHPDVHGERVFIPTTCLKEDQKDGFGHFFYIDSLLPVAGRVYVPCNKDIKSYHYTGLEVVADEKMNARWKELSKSGKLVLVDPKIEDNGCSHVYLPEDLAYDTGTSSSTERKIGKPFFYRNDLTLVQQQ